MWTRSIVNYCNAEKQKVKEMGHKYEVLTTWIIFWVRLKWYIVAKSLHVLMSNLNNFRTSDLWASQLLVNMWQLWYDW